MADKRNRGYSWQIIAVAAVFCLTWLFLQMEPPISSVAAPPASKPAAKSQPSDFELTTPAFKSGDPIPKKFSFSGGNTSPELKWTKPPAGVKEFAIIMEDSTNSCVHWLIYKIPAATTGLKEAMPDSEKLTEPPGAMQSKNCYSKNGYGGPGPPPGPEHKYVFTLYALDAALDLKPGMKKKELEEAMKGHIIGSTQLVGTYKQ